MSSKSEIRQVFEDASFKNLGASGQPRIEIVCPEGFFLNQETLALTQRVAKAVLKSQGRETSDIGGGIVTLRITPEVLLEALKNAELVQLLVQEKGDSDAIIASLEAKIAIINKGNFQNEPNGPNEPSEDDFFDTGIDNRSTYGELWGMLKDKEGCYNFAQHLSGFSEYRKRSIIDSLHSFKNPKGRQTVSSGTQFTWNPSTRDSEQTKQLKNRLDAPLERDSVEKFTITQLFDLAKNKTSLNKVIQYSILCYAAGIQLKP